MAVFNSRALHEQLSVIMGALTKAAVAEICALVDEGYALLQMEITRSHKENQDLRKKLHLIESIVVRNSSGGQAESEVSAGAEDAQPVETSQQQRDTDEGAPAAEHAGGGGAEGTVAVLEEFPDVVLIKDEDSDSDYGFKEVNVTVAKGGTVLSLRGTKRHWAGSEMGSRKSTPEQPSTKVNAAAQKTSMSGYALDSPHNEPGCSSQFGGGDELEASGTVCSYPSQIEPEVQLVHQECPQVLPSANGQMGYFGNSALMECPPARAELDLSLTWNKQLKNQMALPQFQPSDSPGGDAFGIKLISVSGSASTDSQLSESSSSALEFDSADRVNFALYRDQLGVSQQGASGRKRRFLCSICNRTYAKSQNLDVHMRIHRGERPFSCDQCGKTFTQSAHLKSHLSVHSGDRPHACAVCSRSFIVKYSLKLHMRKCHPDVVTGD